MGLMLAICKPQPNWMPRKPKLMFQICQKLRCGFCMVVADSRVEANETSSINHPDLPTTGKAISKHEYAVEKAVGVMECWKIGKVQRATRNRWTFPIFQ